MPYDKRIEVARFIEDLTASYQGGWYSLISLHGGGSPEAMKKEIWRHYPVGNKVELVERLLDRGVLHDDRPRDHRATGSPAVLRPRLLVPWSGGDGRDAGNGPPLRGGSHANDDAAANLAGHQMRGLAGA